MGGYSSVVVMQPTMRLATTVAAVLLHGACATAGLTAATEQQDDDMPQVVQPPYLSADIARPPPRTAAELARVHDGLLPYRHYYSLSGVGRPVHGFRVTAGSAANTLDYLVVESSDGPRVVRPRTQHAPMRATPAASIPEPMARFAESVRGHPEVAALGVDSPGSMIQLQYLGSFREVYLHEEILMSAQGPDCRLASKGQLVVALPTEPAHAIDTGTDGNTSSPPPMLHTLWGEAGVGPSCRRRLRSRTWLDFSTDGTNGKPKLPGLLGDADAE
ncbi:MAG: hypothetical protein OXT09_32465, partial [Myxococcales bacterium]|nr:hypothetical protein [Myxococcales bacterium]